MTISRTCRTILLRMISADPALLLLIITALLFGSGIVVLMVGVSLTTVGSADPQAPANWSAVTDIGSPTATPGQRDSRLCGRFTSRYPMENSQWYDVCPMQGHIYISVLSAAGALLHGPSMAAAASTDCHAALLATSDLVLLCQTSGVVIDGPSALSLQIVDSLGRPHPPIMLDGQADYSAITVDPNGGLHIAWLDPQPGGIWWVHYATYSGDPAVIDDAIGPGTPLPTDDLLGVITPDADQVLSGFALGSDTHNVYVLWSASHLHHQPPGAVHALTLPLGTFARSAVRQLTVADGLELSSDQALTVNDQTVAVALTALQPDQPPAVAFLVKGHAARVDRFTSSQALFDGPRLTRETGRLHLLWSVWQNDQRTRLYTASTADLP